MKRAQAVWNWKITTLHIVRNPYGIPRGQVLNYVSTNQFGGLAYLDLYKTFKYGGKYLFMVKSLETGIELKKLDSQGRILLPADWRETEVGESKEVYVIKRKGYLKLVPKRKVDLTACFDKVDLNVKSIGDWSEFERKIYGEHP